MNAHKLNQINLNGVDFSIERLPDETLFNKLTFFEKNTLGFCVDWFTGKENFQLKTSGSTGQPKEILIHRSRMVASAQSTARALGLHSGMNALVCLDTQFIAGMMMLVRCFETGMNVIAVEPSSNPFQKIDESIAIGFVALVPYQLYTILNSAERDRLHKIQTAIIGGGALEPGSQKKLKDYACRFYATYGMTETVSHVALQSLNGPHAVEAFHTLPGVTIHQDNRGCLIIEAEFIENKRVITNDLVDLIGATEFRWIGRWDNVINSGGIKLFPEEIEKVIGIALHELKMTNRFFLAGVPDTKLGERAVLVVEGEISDSILSTLSEKLPAYKRPKSIYPVEKFVETPTGKINRKETLKSIPSAKLSQ